MDGAVAHISILICTRDRPAELARCLNSIARQDYPSYDVLVVDSAPLRFPAKDVASSFAATYVFEPLPGLSRARNRGARAARGEIVAMLDDDAVADHEWLAKLSAAFDDPMVMAAAGRIKVFEPHSDEERAFAELADFDCGPTPRVVDRSDPSWFELTCFGGVGNGANLAVRRNALDVWPGFNENLGAGTRIGGCEEHHAFFSLVALGYRVRYVPDAVVRHPFPTSRGEFESRRLRDTSTAVAYFAFLLRELPQYRFRVVKYLAQSLFGVRRAWRTPRESGPHVSRFKSAISAMAGLNNFFGTRRGAPSSAKVSRPHHPHQS